MRKICICCMLVLSVLWQSCEKKSDDSLIIEDQKNDPLVKEGELRNVLYTVLSNRLDLKAFKDIHKSVSKTKEIGLDEITYAKELFSNDVTKFNKAPVAKNLLKSFSKERKALMSMGPLGGVENPPKLIDETGPIVFEYLSPAEIMALNIQFYWPNHENWDGETLPLVAVASDDDVLTAYKEISDVKGNRKVVPVLMTEEDAESIPVLIIGNEEIDYSTVIDKNVIFLSGNNGGTLIPPAPVAPPPVDTQRDIYTLYLGKFRAENLHEPWAKGGPEFIIQFSGTQDFEMKSIADTVRFKNLTSKIKYVISLTRKEAKKKKWYDFGLSKPLLTAWVPELVFGHLFMHEEDGGSLQDLKFNLGGDYKGVKFGVDGTFKFKKGDDFIVSMSLHKDFLLSTGNGYHNGNWRVYESAGVYYTLPMVKHRVYK